jgi:hypothetical protein
MEPSNEDDGPGRKTMKTHLFALMVIMLAAGVGPASLARGDEPSSASPAAQEEVRAKAQPDLEKRRSQAEQEAQKGLDQDAVTALTETRRALKAIEENKSEDARAALERAAGKIDILVGRHPAAALLPVELEVRVIDNAPTDPKAIKELAKAAEDAVDNKDFSVARIALDAMISEMRVRTYHLPLASYPAALKEAARLLDQKKTQEASGVLHTALSALVIIDRVTPLPILFAHTAIESAQAQKDKAETRKLLTVAKTELERAKELGYVSKDAEYANLNHAISDVEKQMNANQDTGSAFTKLKERILFFLTKQSTNEKKTEAPKK